jgi:hypothetical protein
MLSCLLQPASITALSWLEPSLPLARPMAFSLESAKISRRAIIFWDKLSNWPFYQSSVRFRNFGYEFWDVRGDVERWLDLLVGKTTIVRSARSVQLFTFSLFPIWPFANKTSCLMFYCSSSWCDHNIEWKNCEENVVFAHFTHQKVILIGCHIMLNQNSCF